MYQEFFGLKEAPFNLTPDPRFLYLSKQHREALAALVYGVRERKGFTALTGEIGSGKTTLCRAFLKDLDQESTNVALVLNSYLNELELLQTVNQELGIEAESTSKKVLIDKLNDFLLRENREGKTTLLIIDEAQNLSPGVLEQIRMLSNLETESSKLIQIILIGQPELGDLLDLPELEQLNQRIMVRFHISPLQREEVYHYVRHRLNVAGATLNISLTHAALNRLYHFSGGIPRKINLLCDRALLAAYVEGRFEIDARMIATAEKELRALGTYSPGKRRKALVIGPWIQVSAGVVLLGGLLLFFFWAGMEMVNRASIDRDKNTPGGREQATPSPSPTMIAGATETPVITPTPTPTVAPTPSPTPTPDLPGLADLPRPTSPTLPQNWTWDEDETVRVRDADFAPVAAMLTAARLWLYAFPLEAFQELDKQKILSLNMLRIFKRPGLDLGSFESQSDLRSLMVLDIPLVLYLSDPLQRISPAVVLVRVRDELATVADPRLGMVEIGLSDLESIYRKAVVIFPDADHLMTLELGEESEALPGLRAFFVEEGVWNGGQASGKLDEEMVNAIRRFQEKHRLVGTGKLRGPTVALIACMRSTYRPKLHVGP
ncbi:MAG: AAA family ATPase [Candidatus Sumerlaeia bacterium]